MRKTLKDFKSKLHNHLEVMQLKKFCIYIQQITLMHDESSVD